MKIKNLVRNVLLALIVTSAFIALPQTSEAVSSARFGGGDEIIVQGFHWNTCRNNEYGWYYYLKNNAQEIKNVGFTMIWMPPPWRDDSYWYDNSTNNHGGKEGYYWHDFDLNSHYGSASDLYQAAQALNGKGVKVVYDIVANHRDFGRMNNDTWSHPGAQWRNWGGDDGDPFMDGNADLDTANSTVYWRIKDALQDLKDNYYAKGFRWDYVRGFSGYRVDSWMDDVFGNNKGISFGELWKDDNWGAYPSAQQGVIDQNQLKNWADESDSGVFDYNLKWLMQNRGTYEWRHALCVNPSRSWRERAITFVDNHDTGYSPTPTGSYSHYNNYGQHHWPLPDYKREKAYVFILTMPGTPTVFWPHCFDWGLKNKIKELIAARKQAGVRAYSEVSFVNNTSGVAGYVTGNNKTLAVKIDSNWGGPGSGWTVVSSGNGYTVWMSN